MSIDKQIVECHGVPRVGNLLTKRNTKAVVSLSPPRPVTVAEFNGDREPDLQRPVSIRSTVLAGHASRGITLRLKQANRIDRDTCLPR